MEGEARKKITKITGALLISVALFIDLTEFFLDWVGIGLALNPVMSVFTGLIFWLWFTLLGIGWWNIKKLATATLTFFAEIIPGLDAIVGFYWTIGIIAMIVLVTIEYKTGVSIHVSGARDSTRVSRRAHKTFRRLKQSPQHRQQARERLARLNAHKEKKPKERPRTHDVKPRGKLSLQPKASTVI